MIQYTSDIRKQKWSTCALTPVTCIPVFSNNVTTLKLAHSNYSEVPHYNPLCLLILWSLEHHSFCPHYFCFRSRTVISMSPFSQLHHLIHYFLYFQIAYFWCSFAIVAIITQKPKTKHLTFILITFAVFGFDSNGCCVSGLYSARVSSRTCV